MRPTACRRPSARPAKQRQMLQQPHARSCWWVQTLALGTRAAPPPATRAPAPTRLLRRRTGCTGPPTFPEPGGPAWDGVWTGTRPRRLPCRSARRHCPGTSRQHRLGSAALTHRSRRQPTARCRQAARPTRPLPQQAAPARRPPRGSPSLSAGETRRRRRVLLQTVSAPGLPRRQLTMLQVPRRRLQQFLEDARRCFPTGPAARRMPSQASRRQHTLPATRPLLATARAWAGAHAQSHMPTRHPSLTLRSLVWATRWEGA